jgi:crossover junction endodeoxyribonuclease RuvC
MECVAFGVIITPPDLPMHRRLLMLHKDLRKLFASHHPDTCAVEKLFFQRNVSTAIAVGEARGIVMLAIAEMDLDVAEYTPNEVKQAVAGYGSAQKRQVQEMVRTLLGLPEIPKPDDAADALAIAITHLSTKRYS